MSTELNEELENEVHKKGPGDLLQAARIEQGTTIEDIARQMNLNAKILKSIEENEYDDIQSPIFIKGYLRTYARLVGLDPEKIITLFSESYQQSDPAIRSIRNTLPEISSNDFRVKWMTYIVVIGLIALISVWWVNNYRFDQENITFVAKTPVEESEESEESEETDGSEQNESSSFFSGQSDEGSLTEEADSDIDSSENQLNMELTVENSPESESIDDLSENIEAETSENEQTETQDEVVEVEAEETLVTETEPEPEATVKETQEITEDVANVEPEIVEEITTELPDVDDPNRIFKDSKAGTDRLVLKVTATSWGKISDELDYKFITDLLLPGKTYEFVGTHPFKIFLGNGHGVEVSLNGQSIDFKSVIKSNNTVYFLTEK